MIIYVVHLHDVTGLTFTDILSRQKWLSLVVILMAPFMAYVDIFIVTVANPSIEHGLHASSEEVQFVVAGYAVAYAVNLITAGRLGDTYGRKRIFMIGMAGFTITSVPLLHYNNYKLCIFDYCSIPGK